MHADPAYVGYKILRLTTQAAQLHAEANIRAGSDDIDNRKFMVSVWHLQAV